MMESVLMKLDDCTFIVKTFERPQAVRDLITSIRKFYPDVLILVADDSQKPKPIRAKKVKFYALPFDMGLSYGRNFLVNLVKTKYTVLLDDDFIFNKDTKIEKFKRALDTTSVDIVAGDVENDDKLLHYRGLLEREGNILYYRQGNRGKVGNIVLKDLVLNFFMARTSTLKKYPWDDNLKVAEHTDWMWRTKGEIKKGYLAGVKVVNSRAPYEGDMERFRKRGKEFTYKFMDKHNLKKIVQFDGLAFTNPRYADSPFEEIQQAAREAYQKRALVDTDKP